MFNSALLAGFFWATAHFMPLSTVGTPPIVANISPVTAAAVAAKKPVLMASISAHSARPSVPLASVPLISMPLDLEIPQAVADSTPQEEQEQEEQEFIERINVERAAQGLNTLTVDSLLEQTARAHSEEMCTREYFDHHSPTPGLATPMDRYLTALKASGSSQPHYLLVGENIYYCSVFNDIYNVDYAHRALMNSPGHRANILEPRFTKIGLGIYHSASGGFWVTEMFSRDTNP